MYGHREEYTLHHRVEARGGFGMSLQKIFLRLYALKENLLAYSSTSTRV